MIGSIDLAVLYYQNQRKTLGVIRCHVALRVMPKTDGGNPSHQARPDGGIT